MTRSLVIARVGAASLHRCWVDRGRPRDWDLHLCPYQEIGPQDGVDCTVSDVIPGPKWSGLRELLNTWDGWREYDMVWLPDDDIFANQDTITAMFDAARGVGLQLFAPALHESSHFAHFITMRNSRFFGRWTGFVEIMMPAFTTAALEALLPTLDLTETGWGWGLDSLWPKLLDHHGVGIIDGTPVIHTRPVGQMRDLELARRVLAESDAILTRNDCRQMHVTYDAFGPDLQRLDLSPEALLAELVRGAGYLIDHDPRVLAWIAEFQRPRPGWPEYPVAGTPEAVRNAPSLGIGAARAEPAASRV
jgi:hypothetical protein